MVLKSSSADDYLDKDGIERDIVLGYDNTSYYRMGHFVFHFDCCSHIVSCRSRTPSV
jgi:hypothetical protein